MTLNTTGRLVPDDRVPTLKTALDGMTADWESPLRGADTVLLVPDTHYPFHYSTGLVTVPSLVLAASDVVDRLADGADVAVMVTGGRHVSAERAGSYLGYDRIADAEGIEVRTPDDDDPSGETVVVNLPTVREEPGGTVRANLARAFDPAGPSDSAGRVRAPGTVLTVLDGTYSYTGTPQRSLFLVESDDVDALNETVVELLGRDGPASRAGEEISSIRTAPLSQIAARIGPVEHGAAERLPDALDDAMEAGYRLYGRLSGDAVPPQFIRGER